MASDLFTKWLIPDPSSNESVSCYVEQKGAQATGLALMRPLLAEHFVGEIALMKLGGYGQASEVIKNSLPSSKRIRAGDLGELLATEYVNSETEFTVPIKKLQWKSDRQMPMHGNDVLGIDYKSNPHQVLKCECKSRKQFGESAVNEASTGLDGFDGRPNPSTLAFITKRLFEQNKDDEAKIWNELQTKESLPAKNVVQMVFGLAGNNPVPALAKCPESKIKGIKRKNAAIKLESYAEFIETVYKTDGK